MQAFEWLQAFKKLQAFQELQAFQYFQAFESLQAFRAFLLTPALSYLKILFAPMWTFVLFLKVSHFFRWARRHER